jgi:hypothetical protein
MFKNKKVLVIVGILVAVVLLAGIYFFIANKSKTDVKEDEFAAEQVVEEISPEEIGLTMEANSSNKAVRFKIAKADGITSIEYQVVYEADSTAAEQREGGEERVQRGITGEAMIKAGQSSYQSDWLDLGSCSKNVCRYDSGVESVMLTLKIVKDDGKVYQVEQTLKL